MARSFDHSTMRLVLTSLAIGAFATVATWEHPARPAEASGERSAQTSTPIAAGGRVRVRSVSGDITASAGSGPSVLVRAHIGGRDGALFGIHVDRAADGSVVCATHRSDPSETCDGHHARDGLSIETVDGSIDLALPRGDYRMDARSLSGSIDSKPPLLVRAGGLVGSSASVSGSIGVRFI